MQKTEKILGGYEGKLLWTVSVVTMCSMGARFLLPPLLPVIISDLAISPSTAGFGLTILWGCAALSHFPGGSISDELSRKTLLVPSIIIMVFGVVMLLLVNDISTFFIGVIALGIGSGLYTPVAMAQMSDLYKHRRGLAMGINSAFLNLGGLVGSILAFVALSYFKWQVAFFPIVVLLVVTSILLHVLNNQPYVISKPERIHIKPTLYRLTRSRQLRWTLATAMVFGFSWQGILSFLPAYLNASKEVTPMFSSVTFGGVFLLGMFTTPLAGRLGDRWTCPHVALISTVLTTIGLATLLVGDSIALVVVGLLVLSVGLMTFWPVLNSHIMNLVPTDQLGGDYGAIRTVFIAAESIGPAFVGYTVDHFGYTVSFSGITIALTISIFFAYILVNINGRYK
ncbi:MFS transporter [Natrinema gelatinilyticum]|uniref:MFS transporter n=1 Tax=Natrinema gelatinilyticum TaxID=2961571 RepID=UPI0020C4BC86|nr:MFS transporter [Natrinema gelatinilyticum]